MRIFVEAVGVMAPGLKDWDSAKPVLAGEQEFVAAPLAVMSPACLPAAERHRSAFRKLRRRGAFDFPVLNVGVWMRPDAAGAVADIRIVVGAVGSAPLRARAAEDLLRGQRLEADTIAAAAEAAYRPAKPLDNTDFVYAWRKQMVRNYVREALEEVAHN